VHAGHPPMTLRFLAHGHAAAAQPAARRVDRKFVFVPDRFADGMKGTLLDLQAGGGMLMEIALTEIAEDLEAAVEHGVIRKEDDFGVQAIAELALIGFVESIDAAVHGALHLVHQLRVAFFVHGRYMNGLCFQIDAGAEFSQEVDAKDAVDFATASFSDSGKIDGGQFQIEELGLADGQVREGYFFCAGGESAAPGGHANMARLP